MRVIAALSLCLVLFSVWGCGGKGPTGEAAGEKDAALRAQLVGVWERPWDFGPIGYVRALNADGALVMDELRDANSSPVGPAAVAKPLTMDHPVYKVKLRTCRREEGTWGVENGNLTFAIRLANGDLMRMCYKVERVSTTELVLSSPGPDGKSEAKFRRAQASKG